MHPHGCIFVYQLFVAAAVDAADAAIIAHIAACCAATIERVVVIATVSAAEDE